MIKSILPKKRKKKPRTAECELTIIKALWFDFVSSTQRSTSIRRKKGEEDLGRMLQQPAGDLLSTNTSIEEVPAMMQHQPRAPAVGDSDASSGDETETAPLLNKVP